jgi:ubiquinone/menaquinone biosynthesis C-methylase UbiE
MDPEPWTGNQPIRMPFPVPRGRLGGWLSGRAMLAVSQREVADLLDVPPGSQVLEVGYGSGALLRCLRQSPARRICGVDPSRQMRRMARRRCPRADLRLGTAARTGFADGEFDRVVSVHNVGFWPNLSAGLRELNRVTRPGGLVLIAWPGGHAASGMLRRIALPERTLSRLEQELGELFSGTERHELENMTAFTATRPAG